MKRSPDGSHLLVGDAGRIAVDELGAGPPVVLLHGSGGGPASWNAVAEILARDHRVHIVHRQGYGDRDPPRAAHTFTSEAHIVATVLRQLVDVEGNCVHLVGASYGASLALHTALVASPQIASLALYEAPLLLSGARLRPVLAMQRWSRITLPVLLMQGADTWSPVPEGMAALAEALPRASRRVWEGQSHFATSTDPELVAAALRDFWLRRTP